MDFYYNLTLLWGADVDTRSVSTISSLLSCHLALIYKIERTFCLLNVFISVYIHTNLYKSEYKGICWNISLFARCSKSQTYTEKSQVKRKKKRSRAEIIGSLPIEEVLHEVEDKTCDICGSEMKTVGREFVHDELIYEPARMYVRKHYVEVVKCVSCGKDESKDAESNDIAKEHFRKAKAPALLIVSAAL